MGITPCLVELGGDLCATAFYCMGQALKSGDIAVIMDSDHARHTTIFIDRAPSHDHEANTPHRPLGVESNKAVCDLSFRGVSQVHGRHDDPVFEVHVVDRYR